jgi:excisionase family DNA binding protein
MATTKSPDAVLLRPAEAAELLGISRSKVYELIRERRIPAVTLGSSVRVHRNALLDQLAQEAERPVA